VTDVDVERNKRNVVAFFTRALNDKEPEAAAAEHIGPVYVQHNPAAPDGAEAFSAFVRGLAQQFPELHLEIKHLVAEGDLVAVHSHVTLAPEERGNAVVDLFRLDRDGKIVEHWDVVQPVPETSVSGNGMF
jgi:predicted SnoaL-like aldol condensation-catalyzing enzyme